MAKVELTHNRGERMAQPQVYNGVFKQYGKTTDGIRRDYFMLREAEGGRSLIPPLWDFKKPSFTKESELGTIQVYKGYEYIDDKKYYQEWHIDYCGDTHQALKDARLAEQTSAVRSKDEIH